MCFSEVKMSGVIPKRLGAMRSLFIVGLFFATVTIISCADSNTTPTNTYTGSESQKDAGLLIKSNENSSSQTPSNPMPSSSLSSSSSSSSSSIISSTPPSSSSSSPTKQSPLPTSTLSISSSKKLTSPPSSSSSARPKENLITKETTAHDASAISTSASSSPSISSTSTSTTTATTNQSTLKSGSTTLPPNLSTSQPKNPPSTPPEHSTPKSQTETSSTTPLTSSSPNPSQKITTLGIISTNPPTQTSPLLTSPSTTSNAPTTKTTTTTTTTSTTKSSTISPSTPAPSTTQPPSPTTTTTAATTTTPTTTTTTTTPTTTTTTTTTTTPTTTTPTTTTTTTTPTTTTSTTTPAPSTTPATVNRYCKYASNFKFKTRCTPCRKTPKCTGENVTTVRGKRCTYKRGKRWRKGCQRECQRQRSYTACCAGHAGPHCDPCPGGSQVPCNANGQCLRSQGTCQCNPGFSGKACDTCLDSTKYGPKCSNRCQCKYGSCNNGVKGDGTCACIGGYTGNTCSLPIPGCSMLQCEQKPNMVCKELDGEATCLCKDGYRMNEHEICMDIYPCDEDPSLCPNNTKCVHLSAGNHKCSCDEGFLLHGTKCVPTDPCKRNNGMCDANQICISTNLVRTKYNINETDWLQMIEQFHINLNANDTKANSTSMKRLRSLLCDKCVFGYWKPSGQDKCIITDICINNVTCDPNAVCSMVGPGKTSCKCKAGFEGDGRRCTGDILQVLTSLKKTYAITYGLRWLSYLLGEHLANGDGPFTIFLPDNKGFSNAFKGSTRAMDAFLTDRDRSSQIMRQHILIGKYSIEDLQSYDKFYTLQGNSAEVQIRLSKGVFKFKLHESFSTDSSGLKSKVMVKNIPATNGIIHIVNKVLTLEAGVEGNGKRQAIQLIQSEPRYSYFNKMVNAVGMGNLFANPDITVLAPDNDAWVRLPEGTLDYLVNHTAGREKLKVLIKNHIIPGHYDVFSLIKQLSVTSLVGLKIKISITELGRIQLGDNGDVNVTQVNIPCSNGFYHHVSGLLVPDYLQPLVPNRCNKTMNSLRKEKCKACPIKEECSKDSTFQEVQRCIYADFKWPTFKVAKFNGCQAICTRIEEVTHCCDGFYSTECRSCPGGFVVPCNGRGMCHDGYLGNGTCNCDEGFSGTACEECEDENMYGPHCNMTCQCLHGQCDNGPKGNGMCKLDTCLDGYLGDLCDKHITKCPPGYSINRLTCHAHASCYVDSNPPSLLCMCNRGYVGDGDSCVPINPCEREDNGGCHSQAKCEVIVPGAATKCTCLDDWKGDGFYCSPVLICEANKTLCRPDTKCMDLEPGKYECVKLNKCEIDNGGCHKSASCSSKPDDTVDCTCPDGLMGDGKVCYGTIFDQVRAHPNLTQLAKHLNYLPNANLFINMRTTPMTFLAPSDAAIEKAGSDPWLNTDMGYDNLFDFMEFHTLLDEYTVETFRSSNIGTIQKYPTYYDGFSIHIANLNQSLHIFVNNSDFAQIVVADIPAINGILHIIDSVLEPFYPDQNSPELKDAMLSRKELSLFEETCNTNQFFKAVDSYMEFTVFAPIDKVAGNTRWNEAYLAFYRFPTIILTPSIMNKDHDYDYLNLNFTILENAMFVNHVRIVKSDILVEGGVMHIIDGLLHNRCDTLEAPQCCEGFYGPDCKECPVCGERATCDDGLNGIGTCSCWPGIKPPKCQECIHSNMTGPRCDIPLTHCDVGADVDCSDVINNCIVTTSGEKCKCPLGLISVDNECTTSCKKVIGHECHPDAACVLGDKGLACVCKEGYHGNGVATCIPNTDGCRINNGGCDTEDRATCTYTPPPQVHTGADTNVSCACVDGFVGDGRLCSSNLLDAASRIPQLGYFTEYLSHQENSTAMDLMENLDLSFTMFLPISQDWTGLEVMSLAVLGRPVILDRAQLPKHKGENTDRWSVNSYNGEEITIRLRGDDKFYINDVLVVRKNIQAVNGILHLTSKPIAGDNSASFGASSQRSSSNTTLIAASVVGSVVLIGLLVAAVIAYRRWKARDISSFGVLKSQSDSSMSFSRLQANDSDDSFRESDAAIAKYDNPVFESNDNLLILT